MTQEALGEKVGVSGGYVSQWETGTSPLTAEKEKKLEKVLGPLSVKKGKMTTALPDTMEVSSFGAWLRDQRNEADMSVPELAQASGVTPPTIYGLESGKFQNPQASTRDKLAAVFKASVPDEVVTDTEQEQTIVGRGSLIDFDPNSEKDWPTCPGVYVLYDISQRPLYVGKAGTISSRLKVHSDKFWFRSPLVTLGSYIEVQETQLVISSNRC